MRRSERTEPMSRQELRAEIGNLFCGCGSPDQAWAALYRLLCLHPLYDHREEFEAWVPDDGLQMLLLYWLDNLDLTEHGSSVGSAWLSPYGKVVLDALATEAADNFDVLSDGCCIHGYSIEDDRDEGDCPGCAELRK